MQVLIDNTVYEVIDTCDCCEPKEVCILQTFEYANGVNRQSKIWTKNYEVYPKGE